MEKADLNHSKNSNSPDKKNYISIILNANPQDIQIFRYNSLHMPV